MSLSPVSRVIEGHRPRKPEIPVSSKSLENIQNDTCGSFEMPVQRFPVISPASAHRQVAQMGWARSVLAGHPQCNVVKLNMAGSGNLAWNKADNPKGEGKEAMKKRALDGESQFNQLYGVSCDGIANAFRKDKMIWEKSYSTFSIAGPQGGGGLFDRGDNSIENNVRHGVDLLDGVISSQEGGRFYIGIKGHSRDAVAASQVAKIIEAKHADKIEAIRLLLCDPVPGPSHAGIDLEIDLNETYTPQEVRGGASYKHPEDNLESLSGKVESTLIYSLKLKLEHTLGFTPQIVRGAQRIILTTDNHTCGLDEKTGNNKREFERDKGGLKINELSPGVYFYDRGVLELLTDAGGLIQKIEVAGGFWLQSPREVVILKVLLEKFDNDPEIQNRITELTTSPKPDDLTDAYQFPDFGTPDGDAHEQNEESDDDGGHLSDMEIFNDCYS